jgi:hypothetical protein
MLGRMTMKTKRYTVIAYKWGERDMHSYPIGVTSRKKQAIDWAEEEEEYRGGKYACEVTEFEDGNPPRDNKDGLIDWKVIKPLRSLL